MNDDRLGKAASLILALCALIITGLLIRREFFTQDTTVRAAPASPPVTNWREYASAGHQIGPDDAPVTIVEFADFECPYCRIFAGYIDSLNRKGPQVRVLYRHFFVKGHRFAGPAAKASECAANQGRFAPMHDALFAYPDSMGLVSWWWYAGQAGVPDSTLFAKCLATPGIPSTVEADLVAARKLQVTGTPTLLIGEHRVDGVPSLDSLRRYLERARHR